MATTSKEDAAREDRERQGMTALPAIFTDGHMIVWWPGGLRISFSEWLKEERHYRVAVMMPVDAAEDLVKSLQECIEHVKSASNHGG